MNGQLSLPCVVQPHYTREMTLDERFELHHRLNPHVAEELREMALKLKRHHGITRCGIRMLWERLRWKGIVTYGEDTYRLNDRLTSRYARLLEETTPELRGMFEMRELRS